MSEPGIKETTLVMGKHSGRAAFKDKLKELGYELGDNAFQEAFQRFKDLADRKKHVYDADIVALVDDEAGSVDDRIKLVAMEVVSKTGGVHRCDLTLSVDGVEVKASYDGTGSVDAIFTHRCNRSIVNPFAEIEGQPSILSRFDAHERCREAFALRRIVRPHAHA